MESYIISKGLGFELLSGNGLGVEQAVWVRLAACFDVIFGCRVQSLW